MPLLLLLSLAALASSLSLRVLDPVIPEIARDLSTEIGTAALLASAIAFPARWGNRSSAPWGTPSARPA